MVCLAVTYSDGVARDTGSLVDWTSCSVCGVGHNNSS